MDEHRGSPAWQGHRPRIDWTCLHRICTKTRGPWQKKKDQAGIEPLTEGSKAGCSTAELRRHHGSQSRIGERKVLHRSIRRQKKNYPAVKLRVDFFEDEPGKFSPTGKKIPGSSLKVSTRIFTAGYFFFLTPTLVNHAISNWLQAHPPDILGRQPFKSGRLLRSRENGSSSSSSMSPCHP